MQKIYLMSMIFLNSIMAHAGSGVFFVSNPVIKNYTPTTATKRGLVSGYVDVIWSGSKEPQGIPDMTCSAAADYYFGPMFFGNYKNAGSGYAEIVDPYNGTVLISCKDDWPTIIDKYKKKYGTSARVNVGPQIVTPQSGDETQSASSFTACMSISNASGWSTIASRSIPGIPCQNVPPPPVYCNSLPDMVFDHGSITVHTKSVVDKTMSLTCSGASGVNFSLGSPLTLDASIVNDFKINDIELTTTPVHISVTSKTTTLKFSSTIEDASTGGDFSSSTVLLMSID